MALYKERDVIQFNEKHKWRGALGFISDAKPVKTENGEDVRYMIGCTIPDNEIGCSTAYIYSMESEREFDALFGEVVLMPADADNM